MRGGQRRRSKRRGGMERARGIKRGVMERGSEREQQNQLN